MNHGIGYLNTDLDVTANEDLHELAAALESAGIFPLHVTRHQSGDWSATFEVASDPQHPETDILVMLAAIESLTETQRSTWLSCKQREFNIGYDCGDEPWAFNQGLSHELLRRVVSAGISLRWTLYPVPQP